MCIRLTLVLPLFLAACASTPRPHHAPTYDLGSPPPAIETSIAPEPEAYDPLAETNLAKVAVAPLSQQSMTGPSWEPPKQARWADSQAIVQGWFGVTELDTKRTGGTSPDVEADDTTLPVLGGGAQWKLTGEKVDFGFEGMFSFAWRANVQAFAIGGSGAAVAVDVDLLTIDLFGGPFVNVFLGERWRTYVAAGPVLQWADFDQSASSISGGGSGFGTGWYARGGIELAVNPGLWVGLGVRWADTSVDLDSGLGDLDIEGAQYVLTVTKGI